MCPHKKEAFTIEYQEVDIILVTFLIHMPKCDPGLGQ